MRNHTNQQRKWLTRCCATIVAQAIHLILSLIKRENK